MGAFDYVRCDYPMPDGKPRSGHYQTKSMDWPYLNLYVIREDGSLWREVYDIEDRSDPNAKGPDRIIGMMTRVNEWIEPCRWTGEVRFYSEDEEYSAYFVRGELKHLIAIHDEQQGVDDETS